MLCDVHVPKRDLQCTHCQIAYKSDFAYYTRVNTFVLVLVLFYCRQAKDIAHIWELGGGTFLSKLVSVPITATTIM